MVEFDVSKNILAWESSKSLKIEFEDKTKSSNSIFTKVELAAPTNQALSFQSLVQILFCKVHWKELFKAHEIGYDQFRLAFLGFLKIQNFANLRF